MQARVRLCDKGSVTGPRIGSRPRTACTDCVWCAPRAPVSSVSSGVFMHQTHVQAEPRPCGRLGAACRCPQE